jgi:hypothetical protein
MAERMQVVEERSSYVERELKTNGGGSLKDTVLRIEAQQRLIAVHTGGPVVPPGPVQSPSSSASFNSGEVAA